MPIYTYKCKNGHVEDYWLKMGAKPDKCEHCKSKKLEQVFTVPNATVEQDPKTLGELADKNAKKFGKEECLEREMKGQEEFEKKSGKKKKKSDPPWWRSGRIPGLEKSDKPISGKLLKKYEKIAEDAGVGIDKITVQPRKPKNAKK